MIGKLLLACTIQVSFHYCNAFIHLKSHTVRSGTNNVLRSENNLLHIKNKLVVKSTKDHANEYEIPKLEEGVECDGGRDMITHIKYLDRSLVDLTDRGVYERMNLTIPEESTDDDIYQKICRNERYVLISHGTQEEPVYNFGNSACLQAFARSWENLTSMPSKKCVISMSEDEALRIQLMQNVTDYGFVDGEYRGYRVRGDGKFIKLTECCVWNCYDDNGEYIGQAALFDREISPVVNNAGD